MIPIISYNQNYDTTVIINSVVTYGININSSINVLLKNGFIPNKIKYLKNCYTDILIQLYSNFNSYDKEEQKSIINITNNIFSL